MKKYAKIQIKLKSLDTVSLFLYCTFLKKAIFALNANSSVFSLPIKTRRVTLLKSPHVHKSSREQFQLQVYKKTFYVFSFSFKQIAKYLIINKPANIHVSFRFSS